MLNYNNFIKNKINENVKHKLFSDEIMEFLENLVNEYNDAVASYLLSISYEEQEYGYVEFDENVNYFRFIDINNIDKFNNNLWDKDKKEKIKIGRFINKISNYKFLMSIVENFLKRIKSEKRYKTTNFKIFKGEEIRKWYSENSHSDLGSLGSSCMRHDRCQQYMDIYVDNPEKISLLVLFDKDVMVGRSLLWLLYDGRTMMDVIYSSYEYDHNVFIKYAKDNGIDISYSVIDDGIKNVYTYLKPKEYKFYPYLDTMCFYNAKNGMISDNFSVFEKEDKVYILDDTYGSSRT